MRANQEMMIEGINVHLAQRALTRDSEMRLTIQRYMAESVTNSETLYTESALDSEEFPEASYVYF